MINYTPIAALSLLFLTAANCFAANASDAQSPAGEWLVKDRTAHMRIANCEGKFWGVISWSQTPDTDKNNPDPAKRSRPVLGMPILLGMQAGKEGGWDGTIYNAENGKNYVGGISLKTSDVLHVKGCVLGGFICGGEDWTRLPFQAEPESDGELCKRVKGL